MAKKIGISLDNETLELCDEYAEKTSHSRSEFIAKAIREYVSSIEVGRLLLATQNPKNAKIRNNTKLA